METFFKMIKVELIWRNTWHTRRQAELAIFHSHGLQENHCRAEEYINGFYNPRRRHSALGWKSPTLGHVMPCRAMIGFGSDSRLNENSERH